MATAKKLFADLIAGKFEPAYYFYGTEDYRIVEAEKFLVRQFLPDLQAASNYRKLDGRRTSTAELLAQLSNLPMLGQREVIAVSDIQSFKPTDLERILKLLTPPDPNRVVVFSSPSVRIPDKRGKTFKAITEAVESVEFKPISDEEAASIATTRLQKEGIALEPRAMRLFLDSISGSRGALEQELLKLINYLNGPARVTEAEIKRLVPSYASADVFKVADKVSGGETDSALKELRSLLADGNSPDVILSLMHTHFLSLYLVKNNQPITPRMRWKQPQYQTQARRYSSEQLEQILLLLADCWSDLRQGIHKPEARMEILFVALTEQGAKAA